MTTYRTRPIRIYQHPTDVLNDVMEALNEAVRSNGLPLSFGLSCEPVTTQEGEPPAGPEIKLVCHYEPSDVAKEPCESCQ